MDLDAFAMLKPLRFLTLTTLDDLKVLLPVDSFMFAQESLDGEGTTFTLGDGDELDVQEPMAEVERLLRGW